MLPAAFFSIHLFTNYAVLPNFFLKENHKTPVIQIDEYAPQMIPNIKGPAKYFTLSTPKINNMKIMMNVVNEVLMLREIV